MKALLARPKKGKSEEELKQKEEITRKFLNKQMEVIKIASRKKDAEYIASTAGK